MKVSVLILTFNEEINLPPCLKSLDWCDDVIIIDSGSTDGTLAIAQEWGAKVLQRPFDNCASQRNFGLTNTSFKHKWILHLDADEVVTDVFISKLCRLEETADIDAYFIPSKLMLGGKWLRFSGMYPSYQVRLGRDCVRFIHFGHGQREDLPSERVGVFDEPYLHYSFARGLSDWLHRHVRYAADEAREIAASRSNRWPSWKDVIARQPIVRRRALKALSFRLPLCARPILRLLYILVIRKGVLDGRRGLTYAWMLALYESMISVLVAEIGFDKLSAEESKGRTDATKR